MDLKKIGSIEAICFILIVMLNHIVLNLPRNFLDDCGSSAALNVLYITALVFAFLFFVFKLFKPFHGKDILDISDFLGGKAFHTIVSILFFAYFIFISGILLRNFSEILKITFLDKVPVYLIMIILLFPAVLANRKSGNLVIKCTVVLVILMLINLLITFIGISPNFTIEKIFPLFGYGSNETFFSGATNVFAFFGLSYLYFLPSMLKNTNSFSRIGYIAIGISSFYLFLSVASLLLSLSGIKFITELSPVYLLVRSAEFGRFFQRPDALFILVWILCFMGYLSTVLFMLRTVFIKVIPLKDSRVMSYCFSTFLFIVAILPKDMLQIRFLENTVFKYVSISLLFIITFLILIFANLKLKYNRSHNLPKGGIQNEKKIT